MSEIKNYRLCTFYPELVGNKGSRAIFAKGKLWTSYIGKDITYSFVNTPREGINIGNTYRVQNREKKMAYSDFITKLSNVETQEAKEKYQTEYPCDQLEYQFRNEALKAKDGGLDLIEHYIDRVINERFLPIVNLNFVKVPKDGMIRIKFHIDVGCNSKYGTDALNVTDQSLGTINFSWFDIQTVMHEFGHALGLLHEHQSPIVNSIKWNEDKVYEWAVKNHVFPGSSEEIIRKVDSQILARYGKALYDPAFSSDYDPDSIMLYSYPGELTTNGIGVQAGLRLSLKDVTKLYEAYPPTEKQISSFLKLKPIDFLQRIYPDKYTIKLKNTKPKKDYKYILYITLILALVIVILSLAFYYF